MEKKALIAFIRGTGLVSASTAVDIAGHFNEAVIDKHGLYLTAGRVCDEYLFLETGFMRSYVHDTDSNEITTNFYAPGEILFEVSSFFNRTRSKENLQALTPCLGWYITYEELNDLFHALPEFREFGRFILVKGYARLKTRMLSMITETAEERYEHLLQQNAEIFKHAPLKNIASYLGVTDTSLSRIRKEFAKR